jgi:threonyl-tRNA synthetase
LKDFSPSSLYALRNTASKLLAAAMCELFPNITLVKGDVSSIGFSYDFLFSHRMTREILSLIEEKMHGIVAKNAPIIHVEMVYPSLLGYLTHHHWKGDKRSITPQKGVISLIKIDQFIDFCDEPFLENLEKLRHFALYDFTVLEEDPTSILRIFGTACDEKEDLKSLLKKIKQYEKKNFLF